LPFSPSRAVNAAARSLVGCLEPGHERALRRPRVVETSVARFEQRSEQEELRGDDTSDKVLASNLFI
jgi:hypothetical protein